PLANSIPIVGPLLRPLRSCATGLRLIKGTKLESLSEFELMIVGFFATFLMMNTGELLARETKPESLMKYMKSMKTISEEQLQAFILKAREKKNLSQASTVTDPLSQLVLDDSTSKGAKRKTPEKTVRISIPIPKKGGEVATEGDEVNTLAPPARKKRATRSSSGRALLQGGSAQSPPAGSDAVAPDDAEVVADSAQAPPAFLLSKRQEKQSLASYFLGRGLQLPGKLEKELKEMKESSKAKEEKWAKDRKTFTDEVTHLRSQVATQKDQLASSIKEKEDTASQRDALSKEKADLEDMVEVLEIEVGARYDSGFRFALEQLKIVFPDLDESKLGELDALNKIVDGKLVPFAPTNAA
ncbi:hypothetical protein A2U01_0005739, partial [Trifolium medium]|nr:hypothetical protein [Trifolium medium]